MLHCNLCCAFLLNAKGKVSIKMALIKKSYSKDKKNRSNSMASFTLIATKFEVGLKIRKAFFS